MSIQQDTHFVFYFNVNDIGGSTRREVRELKKLITQRSRFSITWYGEDDIDLTVYVHRAEEGGNIHVRIFVPYVTPQEFISNLSCYRRLQPEKRKQFIIEGSGILSQNEEETYEDVELISRDIPSDCSYDEFKSRCIALIDEAYEIWFSEEEAKSELLSDLFDNLEKQSVPCSGDGKTDVCDDRGILILKNLLSELQNKKKICAVLRQLLWTIIKSQTAIKQKRILREKPDIYRVSLRCAIGSLTILAEPKLLCLKHWDFLMGKYTECFMRRDNLCE